MGETCCHGWPARGRHSLPIKEDQLEQAHKYPLTSVTDSHSLPRLIITRARLNSYPQDLSVAKRNKKVCNLTKQLIASDWFEAIRSKVLLKVLLWRKLSLVMIQPPIAAFFPLSRTFEMKSYIRAQTVGPFLRNTKEDLDNSYIPDYQCSSLAKKSPTFYNMCFSAGLPQKIVFHYDKPPTQMPLSIDRLLIVGASSRLEELPNFKLTLKATRQIQHYSLLTISTC